MILGEDLGYSAKAAFDLDSHSTTLNVLKKTAERALERGLYLQSQTKNHSQALGWIRLSHYVKTGKVKMSRYENDGKRYIIKT